MRNRHEPWNETRKRLRHWLIRWLFADANVPALSARHKLVVTLTRNSVPISALNIMFAATHGTAAKPAIRRINNIPKEWEPNDDYRRWRIDSATRI